MATTTLQRTGTSLEVLAPYLPYGIEVQDIDGFEGDRHTLRGIDFGADYPILLGSSPEEDEDSADIGYRPHALLPILRPFSALCTPLEGGEVPAVEVAKLFNPDSPKLQHGWHLATASKMRGEVWVRWPILEIEEDGSDGEQYWGELRILSNYQCIEEAEDGPKVYDHRATDYFRSKHFAVGLTPFDFIAK